MDFTGAGVGVGSSVSTYAFCVTLKGLLVSVRSLILF